MIIAIDGPAGSGKSTVAKLVGKKLKFDYLDTGAMYRMVTLYNLENNPDFDHEKIIESIENIDIMIRDGIFYLNDVDVSVKIRSVLVTKNVSLIASIREVREFLVESQRNIAAKTNSILDGRDIGSVVFPNADFKFYLTASNEVRAMRRFLENKGSENEVSYEFLIDDIKRRDELDMNRQESPLVCVADAIEVNTDELTIDEVVDFIIQKVV